MTESCLLGSSCQFWCPQTQQSLPSLCQCRLIMSGSLSVQGCAKNGFCDSSVSIRLITWFYSRLNMYFRHNSQTAFGCVVNVLDYYCHNMISLQTISGSQEQFPRLFLDVLCMSWTIAAITWSCSRPYMDLRNNFPDHFWMCCECPGSLLPSYNFAPDHSWMCCECPRLLLP